MTWNHHDSPDDNNEFINDNWDFIFCNIRRHVMQSKIYLGTLAYPPVENLIRLNYEYNLQLFSRVSLSDLKIGLNVRIPRDMVAEVINGKIIALCQQNAHDKGQVFTLGVNALLCHGHGGYLF